jgi:hypothetical protein
LSSNFCDCPAGYFWRDCSLGCAGVKTLSAPNGTFSVGGGKRPLPVLQSGCSWLIAPPPPVTSITISFDYVDFATSDQIDIFTGDRETDESKILSITGSQLLRPIDVNASSVLVIMRLYSGGLGFAGFQAHWQTTYIKVNALQTVSYDHPAAIVFLVILSVFLAAAIVLLVLLAIKRRASKLNSRLSRHLSLFRD